jgi:predicted metal-dependent phosphoesterase TrpH
MMMTAAYKTPLPDGWLRTELHSHTCVSKDSLTEVDALLAACRRKGIDRIAITDHNETAGALRAQALDPLRVIVGEEIMTAQGELLAFYVQATLPKGLPALDAIRRLREQDAVISVSHPFDAGRNGAWRLADLLEIAPLVDAIEVFNARCTSDLPNQQALEFARAHGLAGTAGSDAHVTWEVGRAVTLLPAFDSAAGMRAALRHARYETRRSPWYIHMTSGYARYIKWRRAQQVVKNK